MIIENESGVVEQPTLTPSPTPPLTHHIGQRLRLAREQHHYTQQQVAGQLRLQHAVIQRIEETLAPEALFDTFMRGYIRSYARLVHLADHDILPSMSSQPPESMLTKTRPYLSCRTQYRHAENRLMRATWLIIIIMIGLTVGWWWQHCRVTQLERSQLTNRLAGENAPSTQALTLPPLASLTESSPEQPLPIPALPTVEASVAQEPPETTDIEPSLPVTDKSDNLALTTRLAQPCSHRAALCVRFGGECWLEVIDASGKTLFSGLQQAGNQLRFHGYPPYQVTVGAPRYVAITYQDKPVDLSQYIAQNRVAHLTLSQETETVAPQ